MAALARALGLPFLRLFGGGSAVPANSITTDTITDFVTTDAGDYVLTD